MQWRITHTTDFTGKTEVLAVHAFNQKDVVKQVCKTQVIRPDHIHALCVKDPKRDFRARYSIDDSAWVYY